MENKALLIGATGLVGGNCLKLLLNDEYYKEVEIMVRRPTGIKHSKLIETIIDFSKISDLPSSYANHYFCCLGTTIAKAKTKEAFHRVDFNYVIEFSKLVERSHGEKLLVVSSIGANSESKNFYLRTKGEMENKIREISNAEIYIFRPSILLGRRKDFRFGEKIGKIFIRVLGIFLLGNLKKYKGIKSLTVASSMIYFAKSGNSKIKILESNEIKKYSYNARIN